MHDILICSHLPDNISEHTFIYALKDDIAIIEIRLHQGHLLIAQENYLCLLNCIELRADLASSLPLNAIKNDILVKLKSLNSTLPNNLVYHLQQAPSDVNAITPLPKVNYSEMLKMFCEAIAHAGTQHVSTEEMNLIVINIHDFNISQNIIGTQFNFSAPASSSNAPPQYDSASTLKKYHQQIEVAQQLEEIYIPHQGIMASKPFEPSFSILEKISYFLTDTPIRLLLLLGDSGLGKTTLCLKLSEFLTNQNSSPNIFSSSIANIKRMPFYIYLPEFKDSLNSKFLKRIFQRAGLFEKAHIISSLPLLLILDGLDEITLPDNFNFFYNLGLEHAELDVKVIISGRPGSLLERPKPALFDAPLLPQPGRGYEVLCLQPFSNIQIDNYIRQYIQHLSEADLTALSTTMLPHSVPCSDTKESRELIETQIFSSYHAWFERIPALKTLAKVPFILTIAIKTLPTLIEQEILYQQSLNIVFSPDNIENKKLTQNHLFEAFLNGWFIRQAKRIQTDNWLRSLTERELASYIRIYAQNLATTRLSDDGRLNDGLLSDSESLCPQLIIPSENSELFHQFYSHDPESCQSILFFDGDPHQPLAPNPAQLNNIKAIRSGCLFPTLDGRFNFMHRSIVEYLVCQELMQGFLGTYTHYLNGLLNTDTQEKGFNRELPRLEPNIMERLSEAVQSDPSFKKLLYDIIDASKTTKAIASLAASAIEILNLAREDFSNKDFSGIQVPKANLSNSICAQTQWRYADLTDASFSHAYLAYADFEGACVTNVDFGEKAYLQLTSAIYQLAPYKPNDASLHWLVTCTDGIHRYDDMTGELIVRYFDKKWGLGSSQNEMHLFVVDNKNHLLVISYYFSSHIQLRSLTESKADMRLLTGHKTEITNLTMGRDGYLASCDESGTIYLWLLPQGEITAVIETHDKVFGSLHLFAFTPNNLLAIANYDTISLWSTQGSQIKTQSIGVDIITTTAFSNRVYLAVGDYDGKISIWRHASIFEEILTLKQPAESITYLEFSPHEEWLASGATDGVVRLWHLPDGIMCGLFNALPVRISGLSFAKEGWLTSAAWDGAIRWWKIPEYEDTLRLNWNDHNDDVICLTLSSDSRALATGSRDGMIRIWYLPLKSKADIAFKAHGAAVHDLRFRSQSCLLSSGKDITMGHLNICWWHLPGCTLITNPLFIVAHNFKFNSDGSRLATNFGCLLEESSLEAYKNQQLSMQPRTHRSLSMPNTITCLQYSPDNSLLATGDILGTIYLWQLPVCIQVATIQSDTNPIISIAFTPNNQWLASGGPNGTIRLWQLPQQLSGVTYKKPKLVFKLHKHSVISLYFSAYHPNLLISGSIDATLSLWDISSKQRLSILSTGFIVTTLTVMENLLYAGAEQGYTATIDISRLDRPRFKQNCIIAPRLVMAGLNLKNTFGLSQENQRLCQQQQAVGIDHLNPDKPYKAWYQILKPVQHIVSGQTQSAFVYLKGHPKPSINAINWIVSMVTTSENNHAQTSSSSFFTFTRTVKQRALLILEGITQQQHFIVYAELVHPQGDKAYQIIVESVEHLPQLKALLEPMQACQFKLSAELGQTLLRRIIVSEASLANQMQPAEGWFSHKSLKAIDWCHEQLNFMSYETPTTWFPLLIDETAHTLSEVPEDIHLQNHLSTLVAKEIFPQHEDSHTDVISPLKEPGLDLPCQSHVIDSNANLGWDFVDVTHGDESSLCHAVCHQACLLQLPLIKEKSERITLYEWIKIRADYFSILFNPGLVEIEDKAIAHLVRQLDIAIAVADMKRLDLGFTAYYADLSRYLVMYRGEDKLLQIPPNKDIIRLARTEDNHYLSVIQHPTLTQGAIIDAFSSQPMQQTIPTPSSSTPLPATLFSSSAQAPHTAATSGSPAVASLPSSPS